MVDELWHPDGSGGARHDFWSGGRAGRDTGVDPEDSPLADASDNKDRAGNHPELERDREPELPG